MLCYLGIYSTPSLLSPTNCHKSRTPLKYATLLKKKQIYSKLRFNLKQSLDLLLVQECDILKTFKQTPINLILLITYLFNITWIVKNLDI